MTQTRASSVPARVQAPRTCRAGFTLVELLTVIAIIALLIAILMPSLSAARNQAKNVKTSALLSAISAGLEMFKNENEVEFRQSNGYPPSAGYSWDATSGVLMRRDRHEATPPSTDILYGAHWLPRFLMGKDQQGFVQLKAVPTALRRETDPEGPTRWYDAAPDENNGKPLDRVGPYLNPDSVELVPTNELPGKPPVDTLIKIDPANPSASLKAPVIADSFGRPVLYYTANPHGSAVAGETDLADENGYIGIFVQKDNEGFTGNKEEDGWLFGTKPHPIALFGSVLPEEIDKKENLQSFAYYLCDHKVLEATIVGADLKTRTVRGFRTDSFLLITAGKDGIYGSKDDVNNFDQKQ